jgi:hypothetical protein
MANLPTPNPTQPKDVEKPGIDKDLVVQTLEGYRQEAETARRSGPNGRDEKWDENLDLYWNRVDFSKKAKWQARETMPEVPAFVDRFSAAIKEVLNATPTGFYTVVDDTNQENDLADAIKRAMDVWLARIGQNRMGHIIGFPGVFEEQMKIGSLMATASLVTWKEDVPFGRVSMETIDPRSVWLDATGRNLYRVRRIEIDLHDLKRLIKMKDGGGSPLYNIEQIEMLTAQLVEDQRREMEALTGHGSEVSSVRKPVVLHEYLATLLDAEGELITDQGLSIVANNKFLIRGPEKNPFWHGQDWLLTAPLIPVPLSPYGRSYMEDFGAVAKTFNQMTNLILDATFTSAMKSFAVVPSMLIDPGQFEEGMVPNKMWGLEDGNSPKQFIEEINLGTLDGAALQVWSALKNELTEAAKQNEVGIGQFAPKGRTSATEVSETQRGAGAFVRSVAASVEQLHLDPALNLIWKTGLQHVKKNDPAIKKAMGPELFDALIKRRKELVQHPITFAARGISTLLQKAAKLKAVMSALQIMGSNEVLLKEFLQKADPGKLSDLILDLLDIDLTRLQLSDRERLIRDMTERFEQQKAQAEGNTAGRSVDGGTAGQVRDVVGQLGVGRQ